MSKWELFKKSLKRHPGCTIAMIWPLLLIAAMCQRPDLPSITAIAGVTLTLGMIPALIVLYTAWKNK